MTKQETVQARRDLLSAEIGKRSLSAVAEAAGKPASQILDMATGRKAFGDGIAKEIGPKIRPDLPREWLIYPETTDAPYPTSSDSQPQRHIAMENVSEIPKAMSLRELRINELKTISEQIDDDGLLELIGMAKLIRNQRPLSAKQTQSLSN